MTIVPDQFLRALAEPTRLRVVAMLSKNKELCVCELTAALEMAQPKVSRHLAILREGGILLDRREGLWVYYRLHPDLPAWAAKSLVAIHDGCEGKAPYKEDRRRLAAAPPQARLSCKA